MIGGLDLSTIHSHRKDVKKEISPTSQANNIPAEATGLTRINQDFVEKLHQIFVQRK